MSKHQNNRQKLQEGFPGQRMIVLPDKLIEDVAISDLTSALFLTDAGFYPRARFHFRERESGCREYILIYCIEGRGVIETPKNSLKITPNTFCIIPPDTPHTYFSDSNDPWSIYWIHFQGLYAPHFFSKYAPLGEIHNREVFFDERRLKLINSVLFALEDGFASHNIEFVNLNMWQILTSFLYQDLYSGNVSGKDSKVSDVIDLMKASIDQSLTIQDIAEKVNCSPSHLYALFKEHTGYSPLQYFTQLKIQRSCYLLSFSDLSIKEICCKIGIADPFYFSRLFKKVMGLSPSQYRRKHKG
ncbi:helix-turn-helix domain-containing protein [Natronoflexus pectinivorans]|uniref:AraC-like protein n=1 Tax=Natronoflexus pectinivorans TaxID=682526 RepID=A0A4R2GMV0_9BACT|nr:AraC family transcriptional regulator [Natronoflexus pectinivorans]TCO09759.1 AraC-like protein [Natronoflexus pectinivorans]